MRSNPSSRMKSPLFYGYVIALAGFVIMTATFSTRFAFGVFFKPLQAEFGWTRAVTSGAFSLSMILEGLVGILMGGLNDRLGPRAVLTVCGLLVGLGCVLMSQVHEIWHLYLFFGILLGIGMSGAWVPITSTTTRWFIKRRALVSGFVLTGTGLAALIAPPIADLLISNYQWRHSFVIIGIAALVTIFPASQLLRRDPAQMGLLPYGADVERESAQSGAEGYSFGEAALTREFWLITLMLFCFGFCMFTVMVHLVPHATDSKISGATAAKILATVGGISIAGRLLLGNLADRVGNCRIFIMGFIAMSAASLWLVSSKDVWMLYLFALTFGFVQGGMGASESPLVAEFFGLRSHGLIYGVTAFGFTLGGAAGPWLAGYLYDMRNSYNLAFLMCAVTGAVGVLLSILLLRIGDREGRGSRACSSPLKDSARG
jgi:MFS family permease